MGDADGPRVVVFPADSSACGHYRLRMPAEALRARGLDVRVAESGDGTLTARRHPATGEVVGVGPLDADVAVLQRVGTEDLLAAIPHLRARGVAVVVEIDDLVSRIPRDNNSYWAWQPGGENSHEALARACDAADLVTCTTPRLAKEYGGRTEAVVLPNCVPEAWLALEARAADWPLSVGWTGDLGSHRGDAAVARPWLRGVLEEAGARASLVGDPALPAALGVEGLCASSGRLDMDGPYQEAIGRFGVGIAPLADNPFNKGKSWLKPLEYAALGVPWVGTDTPEYRRLGGGACVHAAPEWRRELLRLLGSADLRAERAAAGRARAAEWTVEGRCEDWAAAWRRAADRLARDRRNG